MSPRLIVTALASLGLGFGLGALVTRPDERFTPPPSPAPLVRAPAAPPAELGPAPSSPSPTTPVPPAPTDGPPPPAPVRSTPPPVPGIEGLAAAVAPLEERVRELEHQLAVERHLRKGTEGERIEPPPGLPPRFRDEQQLLSTFTQALKAAGFPAQVSAIDCTEHPCIVFGTGFGERGDMDKLKGQLGPYEEDSFSTFGFGTSDGKKEHRFFGVAVMPAQKGPPDEAVSKRIGFRMNQMHDASKPTKP